MLTTEPEPAAFIGGTKAWQTSIVPIRLFSVSILMSRFTQNDSLMGAVALVLRRHGRLALWRQPRLGAGAGMMYPGATQRTIRSVAAAIIWNRL